jgi:hypothetical protein
MIFTDDEVFLIAVLLHNSKSKNDSEFSMYNELSKRHEVGLLKEKIYSSARKVIANQTVVKLK